MAENGYIELICKYNINILVSKNKDVKCPIIRLDK